jgi:hypothetical protein
MHVQSFNAIAAHIAEKSQETVKSLKLAKFRGITLPII